MDSACEQAIRNWLAEIEAQTPNPITAAAAARTAAHCLGNAWLLQKFVAAWKSGYEDHLDCETCQAQLPDFVQAQVEATRATEMDSGYQDVRNHLALCPYCAEAYADVTEWMVASEADSVQVAATYPVFALPPLSVAAPRQSPVWATDVIERAITEGKQWIEDGLGGLYLLLAGGNQPQVATGWALKSSAPGALLAQSLLEGDEAGGWEIEVSVFADDADNALCRVEIAIYNVDNPGAEMAEIPVTLAAGDIMQTNSTNEGGVVEFSGIPRTVLGQTAADPMIIRVSRPQ